MGCCESCFGNSSESVPEKEQYRLIPDSEVSGATSSAAPPIGAKDQKPEIVQNGSSRSSASLLDVRRKQSTVPDESYGSTTDNTPVAVHSTDNDSTNTCMKRQEAKQSESTVGRASARKDAHQTVDIPSTKSAEEDHVAGGITATHGAKATVSEAASKEVDKGMGAEEGSTADSAPILSSDPKKPSLTASTLDLLHNSSMSAVERHRLYGREFRLFLPLLDEDTDATWLSPDLMRAYKESLDVVRQLTSQQGGERASPEIRDDTYVIGQPYFGLKYRSQNKLEMKVRTGNHPIYLEKWSKVKFGKKKIAHYKQDILKYLSDMGFAADREANSAILENPQLLSIRKSRWSVTRGDVSIEVCEITIPDKQQQSVSTTVSKKGAATTGATISDVRRKKWLSVAVEGLNTDIEGFVSAQHKQSGLLKCLSVLRRIHNAHTSGAHAHGLVPVVSGYPHWVRVVSGDSTGVAGSRQTQLQSAAASMLASPGGGDVMAGVDALLRFVA